MLLWTYSALTRGAAPTLEWLLRRRLAKGREDPDRLNERRGQPQRPRPEGRLIWLHGASVGEALSAQVLVDRLLARDPELTVMVTTGTVSSARLMAERLPARAFHQFMPLDHPGWVRRFLDHWRPDAALWMESEIWPNMLRAIEARRLPAALVNGHMSKASYRRWRLLGPAARRLFGVFAVCHAQSGEEAHQLEALGARHVAALGNLKFSSPPPAADASALAELQAAIGERPVWLFAQTHEGEEDYAARVHRDLRADFPHLLTLIVPRHPERGRDIASLIQPEGLPVTRRSRGQMPDDDTEIYVGDTLGELGLFYRLAPVTVIGGSFVPHGGHTPIEPAQLGRAILHGPHMENFARVCAAMEAAGAVRKVPGETALVDALAELLANPAARARLGSAAKDLAADNRQVVARVLAHLEPVLAQAGLAAGSAETAGAEEAEETEGAEETGSRNSA